MFVVGVTGGIGCGKSAVTDCFITLGIPVIDADLVAREVVEPGQPALAEIVDQFGEQAQLPDGSLNRAWLRASIFSDPQAKTALEQILHPRIRAEMRRRLDALDTPYAIFSIPLLFETGQDKGVDRVLVVDCPPELQLSRVTRRDQTSEAQTRSIIDAQIDRKSRLARADDIIDNSGSLDDLRIRVEQLHRKYLILAG
ncbi:dephospho-CoA kinase [Sedimenticola thiotaurini]|uniref:Dephospho-CoA kinase n=1 Tax=Sedimenticola thiotaurini TaxID=1543721 RepID=A0A0F7K0J1_9GAMM|nr:dephospho-CoA kinase [Sedimenticola thiotaurini]AKH20528.1 dephospho-CoA kinase [Sedimenticola thiotaurini]